MDYYKISFKNLNDRYTPEVLVAQLAEIGFESFEEEDDKLTAYIQAPDFIQENMLQVEGIRKLEDSGDIKKEFIKAQNWNAVWESNYDAVTIKNCHIRAPFHEPNKDVEFNILLNPKMAFGTAHHETTAMMIEFVLNSDSMGLKVLDMGSGTAVLAILASMKGALKVTAIDNDEWAFQNANENIKLNDIHNVEAVLGDAAILQKYGVNDVIFANINKNILLNDINYYTEVLKDDGSIYFSGFYENDLDDIKTECSNNGLVFVKYLSKNNWCAAEFVKQ